MTYIFTTKFIGRFMILKKIFIKALCGFLAGFAVFSLPKAIDRVSAQTYYASTKNEAKSSDSSDDIEDLVAEGRFDSSSLTKEQDRKSTRLNSSHRT